MCTDIRNGHYHILCFLSAIKFLAIFVRHGKTGELGQVNQVAGQSSHGKKTGHFKWCKKGFRSIGWGHIFHMIFFF